MQWWRGALALLACAPITAHAASAIYQLGVGDIVRVEVFQEDELSDTYPISEDGTIEVPMLGKIQASGLSAEELDATITAALGAKYLKNPQVTVQITEFKSQSVQILGEIKEPGVYALTGPTTLEEILAMAGGVKAERSTREAHIKNEGDGRKEVINLDTLRVSDEDAVYLRGGDVIYILQGQIVSVHGHVEDPGEIPFREGMTVLDALSAAGEMLPTANTRRVTLKRGDEYITINVRRIIKQRDEDPVLLSGDKLIVEESIF